MRTKFFSLFAAVFALAAMAVNAQPVIKFEKETHDFGNVAEGTNATYEFKFTNTGNEPLIISAINVSCGCTTPFWTKEPVMPGQSGSVKASYNSQGRPGTFNKSITVQSNASEPSKLLFIKGVVLKPEDMPVTYTAAQLAKSPVISFAKTSQDLGKVEIGQTVVAKFKYSNKGKQALSISKITSSCNCVDFTTSKSSLKPGESAVLELKYAPRNKSHKEEVTVLSNDLKNNKVKLTLSAEVVEGTTSQSIIKENKSAIPFK